MTMNDRIGVLGGTFDPIHIGHLVIADNALEQLRLERILFVPAGSPPHKTNQLISSPAERRKMTEIAITGRSEFEISDIDLIRNGPSYTFDLLDHVHRQYGTTEVFFIMGADSFRDFPTWHRPQDILTAARLAVAARTNAELPDSTFASVPGLRERTIFLHSPLCDVSSSELRDRLRAGKTVRYLVPIEVEEYIKQRGLYQDHHADQ